VEISGTDRFERAAAGWEEKPRRIDRTRDVAEAIREAVALSPEMTALEIGCGSGLVTMALCDYLGTIVALDTSEEALKALQAKIEDMGASNVTPLRLDLSVDPLPDLAVDLIFSSMALHHVADPARMIERAGRLLRLGGFMCIADLDAEDGSYHGDNGERVHHGFSSEQMAELFSAAGLEPVGSGVAHTIERPRADGGTDAYPVLLSLGKKA
jgi:ubiquinone/menaquinone biosynthesis C-methylase UbiE